MNNRARWWMEYVVMTRKLYLQIARSDLNVLRAVIVDFIFYLDIKLWFCCSLFLSLLYVRVVEIFVLVFRLLPRSRQTYHFDGGDDFKSFE